jgi:hypothetical protein
MFLLQHPVGGGVEEDLDEGVVEVMRVEVVGEDMRVEEGGGMKEEEVHINIYTNDS